MSSILILVAQLTCWHVSQGQWRQDANCPATPGDQGAMVYADAGTWAVLTGEFYIDGGWGMCSDGRLPHIANRKTSEIWQTVVDCRGKGKESSTIHTTDNHEGACSIEPKYQINSRGEFWQVHIFCPAAVPAS